jgi:hypothetical protein
MPPKNPDIFMAALTGAAVADGNGPVIEQVAANRDLGAPVRVLLAVISL